MSAQAITLLNDCILKQQPYLELGNCGLTDRDFEKNSPLDKTFKEATHLRTLVLSNGIIDAGGEWIESQNHGTPNHFTLIPECITRLSGLKHFFCNGSYTKKFGITDLNPLRKLTKLIWLDLNNNLISAIDPLVELPALKLLNVSYNKLKELSALPGFPELRNLDAGYNQIRALNGIRGFRKLETIRLNNNWISALSGIEFLPKLETVNLSRNTIWSLDPLIGLTNLRSLNVQYNRIRKLVPLKYMPALSELDARYNEIDSLSGLESLDQLVYLNLRKNYLGSLKGLDKVSRLEHLDIRDNRIETLDELTGAGRLQFLEAADNQLSSVRGIELMFHLKSLDLSNNQLKTLGALADLHDLEYLDFSYNAIKTCTDLSKLTKLRYLNLRNNEIGKINQLQHLTALEILQAGHNRIQSLSPLKKLSVLTELEMANNQVAELTGIEGLDQLRTLDLAHNMLSSKLNGLEKLQQLNSINLSHNRLVDLSHLRDYLARFEGHQLKLTGNPLVSPPLEIVELGREAIVNYFSEIDKQGAEYLFEAKLLIVGQPRAGKTSLRLKLGDSNASLPLEDDSTRGIDINRLSFKTKDPAGNARTFYYNVWDFGGQHIYQATHQFFLTHRSLYLLVVDAGKDGDETLLNYWLQIVELLGGNSPLIIVKNEKNQRKIHIDVRHKQTRFDFLLGEYGLDLNALSSGTPTFDKGRLDEFKCFREDIETQLKRLPLVGFPMPRNWVSIRNELQELSRNANFIIKSQYLAICARHHVTDYNKQMELSRIFHDLGVFLHFQDYDALEDFIIIRNIWATDAVFAALDNPMIQANKGKFFKSNINHIWRDKNYEPAVHNKLLALMMQFELCYRIEHDANETYIIPEMLADFPSDKYEQLPQYDLLLHYRYDFMPKGILTRLIVRLHKYIATNGDEQLVWKTGVLIQGAGMGCSNTIAEITESWNNRQLCVKIEGPHAKDMMNKITYQVDELNHGFFRQATLPETGKSKWRKMIPCDCTVCSQTPDDRWFYDHDLLQQRREFGKETIECERPPFEPIRIAKLLDGMFATEKTKKPIIKDISDNTNHTKKSENSIIDKRTITIFLASSFELEEERNRFEIFIGRENKYLNERGIFLKLEIWEDFLDAMSQIRLQDSYNAVIENCDIFVMLYFTKVGKYTSEEFERAFKQFKKNDKPQIYTYFKKASIDSTQINRRDTLSLVEFQEKLESLGHFQTIFENHSSLHFHFKSQLQRILNY